MRDYVTVAEPRAYAATSQRPAALRLLRYVNPGDTPTVHLLFVAQISTLRCFVAMAFGHDDTDAFYDRLLAPLLIRNGVTPVIINRTDSNDDLNNQIISQLEAADCAVCDLTYARPSVYFEAGYAQRAVPLIYTVRHDHLDPGRPDHQRVHFDLQMKPLVTWTTPDDLSFAARFERRLRKSVLRDLLRERIAIQANADARRDFSLRPVAHRLEDARRAAIAVLNGAGFHGWRPLAPRQPFRLETISAGRINNVCALRQSNISTNLLTLSSFETLTKSELRDFARSLTYEVAARGRGLIVLNDSAEVDVHHIVLCLRALPTSRIESVFTTASRLSTHVTGIATYVATIDVDHSTGEAARVAAYWHFVAPIHSEIDLTRAMLTLISPRTTEAT
jgi:hypothetical protein